MQENKITTISSTSLPPGLQNLYKPPEYLHAKGNVELLDSSRPKVAIVGARKYTSYGRAVTQDIARQLSAAGAIIVSGLALGIDSIAHRTCLESKGKTIAVLPSGLDQIYPASHSQLARDILSSDGLLLSEYAHDYRPQRYNFLERNRIIAALADLVIITEASESSGSLNTANHALEIGVPVAAVPGNIHSYNSIGTNKLIQSGAQLVCGTDDILEILGLTKTRIEYLPESTLEAAILTVLKQRPATTNELVHVLREDARNLQSQLTMLEIKGVTAITSGQWRLK